MKSILLVTLIFAVIGFAVIGCLYIFDVKTMEQSTSLLLQVEAAILLLGGCSALIALLTRANKDSQD